MELSPTHNRGSLFTGFSDGPMDVCCWSEMKHEVADDGQLARGKEEAKNPMSCKGEDCEGTLQMDSSKPLSARQ